MSFDDSCSSSSRNSNFSPIPSVIERLGQLRPSKELLEYYRKKLAEYDNDHEALVSKLDRFKNVFEDQHKTQSELQQKEEEVGKLQNALSDMQTFLFQEREQVLRLYAENDRLKIQEVNDRKKIQHLLSLTKPSGTEVTYLIKEHPKTVSHQTRKAAKNERPHSPVMGHRSTLVFKDRGPGGHYNTKEKATVKAAKSTASNKTGNIIADASDKQQILLLQIEALQAQIEDQTSLASEQINSLLEDRTVRMEESETQCQRDSEKIQHIAEQLKKTQTLLYESTKDYLELKYDTRLRERKWMNERDKIMQEMDFLKEQIDIKKEDVEYQGPLQVHAGTQMITSPNGSERRRPVRATNTMVINQLRTTLEQAQNMAEMYREQVIGLEDELARIREEKDVGKDLFKEKTDKLTHRLHLMNQRYEALEKRRGLEVEGFKNDIRILRTRLKDVEKKLFKVTVNIGEQFDWEILNNVHQTANRSKHLAGQLHKLKTKVYGMESDLKRL